MYVSPHRAGVVAAVIYAAVSLLVVPFFLIGALLESPDEPGFLLVFAVFLPFLYGLMGYCFTALGCLLYNLVAGRLGGVVVEIRAGE